MDIEALVRAFNNLPRSPKVPSGLVDNHWQFGVHHVPLTPPGDLLYLINPGSRYGHSEGPAQILSLPSAAARAEILVPLLLKSFVDALVTQADPYPPVSAYAPWSWGTGNEELAKALEERLKAVGVRKELCKIKIGDDASCAIEEEGWSTLLHELIEMTGSEAKKTIAASNTAQNQHQDICANCKKAPTDSVKVLRFCGACKSVRYCSRDCQKVHWKKHKKDCKHNTISASQGSSVDPIEYYRTVAANMPEAQKLAREIGLIFAPPPNGKPHSLR
jgi:hypothetical protein